jgi:hypothetical protein
VVDAATPFRDADHTQNLTRAERKRTIVEELVEDADSRRYVVSIISFRRILAYSSGTQRRSLAIFNLSVASAVGALWHANLQRGSQSGERQLNRETLMVVAIQSRQCVCSCCLTLTMTTFCTTQDKVLPYPTSESSEATLRRPSNSIGSHLRPFKCSSGACAQFR